MNVAIVTPLYPPDVADTATYVKELATRLATIHRVTVLTYGHIPERIPNVTFVCVNKRSPLLVRILAFTLALFSVAKKNDVLYVINGPSVELPLALVSFVVPTPYVFHMRDTTAHTYTQTQMFRRLFETMVQKKARRTETETPPMRPEILPFTLVSPEELATYETAWQKHIAHIASLLT